MQAKYDPLCYVNEKYIFQSHALEMTTEDILRTSLKDLLAAGIKNIHPLVSIAAIRPKKYENSSLHLLDCLSKLREENNFTHIHPVFQPTWYNRQLNYSDVAIEDPFSFFVSEGIYTSTPPHPVIRILPADRSVSPTSYWKTEEIFLKHQKPGTPGSIQALDWLANHPRYKELKSRTDILREYLQNGVHKGDWWFNAENFFGEMTVDIASPVFADALKQLALEG